MSDTLLTKLSESFDELDRCINITKKVLEDKKGVPQEILERVNQYGDIVEKQRKMAVQLRQFISEQNWEEVTRHVKLINGLSSMIRDDAHAILSSATPGAKTKTPEQFVC